MIANEVIPNLWIGDIRSSLDIDFLKGNNITVIVNCTIKYPFVNNYKVNKIRVPVRDRGSLEDNDVMLKYLIVIIPKIFQLLEKGECILIHCYAGCHRSVALILAFLIKYANMDIDSAIFTLRSKWPRVGLNFYNSLKDFKKN